MNFPVGTPRLKLLFDLRAVCLALGFALAASLPLLTTLRERRDFYWFEVALSSTSSGLTRVSWDSGHGYNERESSAQPLTANAQPLRYLYLLPTGTLQGLRMTPIDRGATLSLLHARVVDRTGAVLRAFSPSDFVAHHQIAALHVAGERLTVDTSPEADEPTIDLRLDRPLDLPLKSGLLMRTAAPVFVPVFLFGLLLSSPWLLSQLVRIAKPVTSRAAQAPVQTILLVSALAALLQAYPVVFLGRSFVSPNNGSSMLYGRLPTLPGYKDPIPSNTMGSDVGALFFHHLYSPMVQRDALLVHGELPLWNRYNLTGTPLLGQGQSMLGDPLNFITIFSNGAGWAWDVRFVLARFVFAAGLGLCVLGLVHTLGPSVLVSAAAPFIGFFLFRINHPANFSVCYAPWILWGWIGYVQAKNRRREIGWLGVLLLSNGWVMTSGTVKEAYMLMVCLNWAGLILLLLLPETEGRRGRLTGYAVGTGILFVMISAPLWGSFLVTLKHSFTVYDKPSVQTLSLTHIIGFFDEIFYRQGSDDERVVAPALNCFYLLGALAWLSNPRLWIRDRVGLALVFAALLPLSLAFGIVPAALVVKIPFIGNILHLGNTFSCPLMVLVAIWAGCGFHDVFRQVQKGEALGFRLATALITGAVLVAIYFATTTGRPKSLFFVGYVAALGFAGVTLVVGAWWSLRSRRPAILAVSVGLALPLLLWRHAQYPHSLFNRYVFTPGVRTDFFARSPAVNRLDEDREHREPSRVIGLQYNLFPTYNVALQWESLYGVDALRNGAYVELMKAFGLVRVWDWEQPTAVETLAAQRRFHDLLNVEYYLADHGTPPDLLAELRPVVQADLDVYGSPSPWPRAFFSDQLASYSSVDDLASLLRHSDGKPFAAVERSQPELGTIPNELAGRILKAATDYRFTANSTTFTVDAPRPGLAVLTETYFPEDFEVTVNGKPASYFRVNHAFKGVILAEAGTYRITFAYWPKYFSFMLGLSGAGLLFAVGGGWILWRGTQSTGSAGSKAGRRVPGKLG